MSKSSHVIILKSRLNSTGYSAFTSEVRDIYDRQTYVPNDWWQLMCSNVLQSWDRRNSMTAPVRNITYIIEILFPFSSHFFVHFIINIVKSTGFLTMVS